MSITMLHNPRCSKSRATLALLNERGIDPELVAYLEQPPTAAELRQILKLLDCGPRALLRKGEAQYRALSLADPSLTDADLIDAMVANPKLIERPIIMANGKAAIGRPPEAVLEIL